MLTNEHPIRLLPPLEAHALWAASYDRIANPLLALEEREIRAVIPTVSGKFVLDLACGTGRWLGKLLAAGARSGVGLDLSREMLREASQKEHLANRLICGQCTGLPLREDIADLAICSFAADYIPALGEFARELSRVMRPDGDLFVTDFHPLGLARGWQRSFRLGADVIAVKNCGRTLDGVFSAFEQAGFDLQVCLAAHFGEPERIIFEQHGKTDVFDEASEPPAIYIAHFQLA